ncbi:MAG: MurR/RpiR family transcriptional regulator [Lactobacillales bacterium]|jgi:DNA-binding MurR/RpiR family transcriptional regulator|nr:MurR/RpiR family transcriptional regulator [Lactobacillales bacterium]
MVISIRLKIKMMYDDFSPKEQIIANFILENSTTIAHCSISDLSNQLGIADSTFFQFTKKLGFNGFKEFKLAMLREENDLAAISVHENITAEDTELAMAQKVFASNLSTLTDTQKLLNQEKLKTAAQMINQSQRLYLFGIGGSEIVAADAYHKFLRSPIAVFHSSDFHIQLMEAALLNENDCVIVISHSGKSRETILIAKTAKEAHAKVIVVTSQATSPLAKLGDVVFISISEETEFRSEALASRIAQLSIMDCLYVILMFYNKKKAVTSITKIRRVISQIKE